MKHKLSRERLNKLIEINNLDEKIRFYEIICFINDFASEIEDEYEDDLDKIYG